jgi:hypothetical protein
MTTRAFEKAGEESESRERGGALVGIVRAVQFGALFWIAVGLLMWAW